MRPDFEQNSLRRRRRRRRGQVGLPRGVRGRGRHLGPLLGLLGPRLGLELLDDGREGVGDDEDHDEQADQQDYHCGRRTAGCFELLQSLNMFMIETLEKSLAP